MTDDLKEKLSTWSQRLTLWLKALWGLIVATFPYSVILIAVVILGIFIGWLTYHGTSKIEKEAEDARTNTIVQDGSTSVANAQVEKNRETVEEAEKTSQSARKQREKAKQTNTSNTSYAQANAERCKTFPESKECQ